MRPAPLTSGGLALEAIQPELPQSRSCPKLLVAYSDLVGSSSGMVLISPVAPRFNVEERRDNYCKKVAPLHCFESKFHSEESVKVLSYN